MAGDPKRRGTRRIVIASILRPTGETGVQTHVNTLVRSEAARDLEVDLVTPFDLSPATIFPAFAPGRLVRPISRGFWVWWYRESHRITLRAALRGRLDRDVPTIVYAQDPVSAAAALELKQAGYPLEIVLAVHFNGSQADEWAKMGFIRPGGRLYRRISRAEARSIPAMDRLVFVSDHSRAEVLRKLPGASHVPSWSVPNFVSDVGTTSEGARIEGDLLSIGSLEPRKNHGYSLRVLAELHARGHRYRLAIVGAGPLRDELASRARDLGLSSFVDFRGYVPNAGPLFHSFRACLHSATLENLPLALIEALAAGRPIFAVPTGGIPEIFDHGVEGCYLDPDDAAAAAATIAGILEAPVRYREMSRAARARFENDFTAERVVPKLLDAIRGIAVPASAG